MSDSCSVADEGPRAELAKLDHLDMHDRAYDTEYVSYTTERILLSMEEQRN